MHAFRERVNLAERTVRACHERVNLVPGTVHAFRGRVHLAERTGTCAGQRLTSPWNSDLVPRTGGAVPTLASVSVVSRLSSHGEVGKVCVPDSPKRVGSTFNSSERDNEKIGLHDSAEVRSPERLAG
jgi:hypothetical protein